MRENRMHGSEGGAGNTVPTPIQQKFACIPQENPTLAAPGSWCSCGVVGAGGFLAWAARALPWIRHCRSVKVSPRCVNSISLRKLIPNNTASPSMWGLMFARTWRRTIFPSRTSGRRVW